MLKFYYHLFLCFLLTACAGLGDDNTPPPAALTPYPFQFRPVLLWSVGTGGGIDKDYLRLDPVIKDSQVFVTNKSGYVSSVMLKDGHRRWQINLKRQISSAPAVDAGVVVLATMQPQLIALKADKGDLLWQIALPNQVLASPTISQGRVVVKTVDGQVLAFALSTGKLLWHYSHGAPTLILPPNSAPQIIGDKVLIGFSDGTLSALRLHNGSLLWERTIAFPKGVTQAAQLVGIAANPVFSGDTIYVVTYQGQLAAIALQTGQTQWQRPFSSSSGLALGKNLFISDSDGGLWAFNRVTGQLLWKNQRLQHRGLTAPVIMGDDLVVGDQEGYLHWLSQADGHPLANVHVHNNASILAAPRVAYPLVCVLTQQGGLSAWTLAPMTL